MKDGKYNGQIINSLFRVTAKPLTVAISINRDNLTCDYIRASGVFSVSILAVNTPMAFIGLFGFKSGREVDKFAQVNFKTSAAGVPIVTDHSVAWLEGRIVQELDCGTHIVFIGELTDFDNLADGPPLTYDYYSQIMKGKSPKNAPTYAAKERHGPRRRPEPNTPAISAVTCTIRRRRPGAWRQRRYGIRRSAGGLDLSHLRRRQVGIRKNGIIKACCGRGLSLSSCPHMPQTQGVRDDRDGAHGHGGGGKFGVQGGCPRRDIRPRQQWESR